MRRGVEAAERSLFDDPPLRAAAAEAPPSARSG
jgi:hypothetical protein